MPLTHNKGRFRNLRGEAVREREDECDGDVAVRHDPRDAVPVCLPHPFRCGDLVCARSGMVRGRPDTHRQPVFVVDFLHYI